MLTLYVKTGCPYCARVLDTLKELDLPATIRNIADADVADELVARGGELQVPYLVDERRGVEMYESEDITEYLHAFYGAKSA